LDSDTEYHEEVEVIIEGITDLGVGRAVHNGRKVLVPCVIPGERVLAKIYNCVNGDTYNAELVEVISPSSKRIKPVCPYFGECSGCQYQHMDVDAQRVLKAEQVRSVFADTGAFPDMDEIMKPLIGTDDVYAYRTKLTPRYRLSDEGTTQRVGFQSIGRRDVLDIESCSIATPAVNTALSKVRDTRIKKKKANLGSLILRESVDGWVATDYKTVVGQAVDDLTFHFPAGSFFQVNKHAVPVMVEYVLSKAVGDGCSRLVDAYCGAGLFALSAAPLFEKVLGVEIDSGAVAWATKNAVANKIENAAFVATDSTNIFSAIHAKYAAISVAIIDPPRCGCSEAFLEKLIEFKPKKVVYISCNPTTQARDAAVLVRNGYTLTELTPVDLFPQTRHIESVATFLAVE
jgi:23S rRNA (uracil1939-C5)-methyltransferase